ncbi:MAG: ATP-binding protein [Clostridia bacterium]|nr:ATP-binding protein [Clostridia bacterium]
MPYSDDNYKTVAEAFSAKRLKAEKEADDRRLDVYGRFPRVKELDDAISQTGMKIFAEALKGKDGIEERIEKIRIETEGLRDARRAVLAKIGRDENYDQPQYECSKCGDTGYLKNGKMCDCFKRALVSEGFKSSGMANLMSKQDFGNFSLDFYSGDDREAMKKNLERVKDFARSFSGGESAGRNMLFIGTTGLGKTHLSSAVAKAAIEAGCDVVYESAQNIFSDFEYERFARSYADRSPSKTDKYFSCDLLIIDDLGTEVSNQFTVSCLYNLMNTRIVSEKSMLISTNVSKEEMLERYSDRILSRLFGEFEVCVFTGKDVRSQKLKKK